VKTSDPLAFNDNLVYQHTQPANNLNFTPGGENPDAARGREDVELTLNK